MSTKTTTVLSKEEIVSKLEGLHFSFEEHYWESFLQSFSEVKPVQTTAAPKVSAKAIAIPIMVLLGGVIIYFSVNTLRSQSASVDNNPDSYRAKIETATLDAPDETATTPKAETTAPAVTDTKTESVQTADATSPAANTTSAPAVVSNTTPAPVATTTPAKTNLPAANTVSARTGTTTTNTATTRYYRRGRTNKEQTPSSPTPSPEEDDVVVPEN